MKWDEVAAKWATYTTRGDKIKSRFIIPAAGPLHRPKLPGLDGIVDFKGHAFHSSRWDYEYTGGDSNGGLEKLKDKKVGIIGTGATAVQIVPHLGAWAKELCVFQRTPSSIDVRGNALTDPKWAASLTPGWQKKRMDNFDNLINGGIEKEHMVGDRWTSIIRNLITAGVDMSNPVEAAAKRQIADYKKMNEIRARTDEVVKDKETADSLKPWYNQFAKGNKSTTFNRPNVTLVDAKGLGVDRITSTGVVANNHEYSLDCIVYATGFELANEWSHKTGIEIHGRDGLTITEKWRDGAQTLHGWGTRAFPNCCFVQVVQAALTPNFMHVTNEQAMHYAYVISECLKRAVRTIEPTQEAEEEWTETIVKGTALRGDFSRSAGDRAGLDVKCFASEDAKPATNGTVDSKLEVQIGVPPEPDTNEAREDERLLHDDAAADTKSEQKSTPEADLVDPKERERSRKDSAAAVDSEEATPESKPVLEPETTAVIGGQNSLAHRYSVLQAKHQAELNERITRQRLEVERLLEGAV
ncbi:hypothetical protein PMIN06_007568 [Paraphaeosphaeria minitans]